MAARRRQQPLAYPTCGVVAEGFCGSRREIMFADTREIRLSRGEHPTLRRAILHEAGGEELPRIPPGPEGATATKARHVHEESDPGADSQDSGLDAALPVPGVVQNFRALDSALFDRLWRWIRLGHRNKRARWLRRRYFRSIDGRSRVFSALLPHRSRGGQQSLFPELQGRVVTLVAASSVRICRHVKVRGDANPFDPAYRTYFRRRRRTPWTPNLGGAVA